MIKIKRISKKDIARFVQLWNQDYHLITSSKFKMTFEKAMRGFKSKMFDYFGLYDRAILVGFMLLKEDDSNICLKHILIEKKYRRKGLGKLLIDKAQKQAENKNKILNTEVLEENIVAKKFFLKNDFEILKFDEVQKQFILQKNP